MIAVEYACADGTPLVVEFDDTAQAASTWRLDREHNRDPQTPLGNALWRLGQPGADEAYNEVGLAYPSVFRPGPDAHGFPYFDEAPMSADDLATTVAGCAQLVLKHGGALGIWHDYCMPRAIDAAAFLASAGTNVPIAALAQRQEYGQQMTMIPAYVCGNDLELLIAVCKDVFGDDGAIVAYELTQGYDNETLRADQELWRLGQAALQHPSIGQALASSDTASAVRAVRAAGKARGWFDALDAFLKAFGARSESWDIVAPTWNEQRDGLWRQVRQFAAPGAAEPRLAVRAAAERREALAREVDERLTNDPDKHARFRRRFDRAAPYVAVREERAHWQLVLVGELRGALLRRADVLVERGAIQDREDVFYLQPHEIEVALASNAATYVDRVPARRAAYERWKTVTPPPVIGGQQLVDAAVPALPNDGVIVGRPVSRGRATGRARVIVDLADDVEFEPGDVLVCVMTAPPWTPLFALAAAVVADTGDIGSHPAIAAREYGIPCVLSTKIATAVIPNGATVTVDGEKGTVAVNLGGVQTQ